jgi:hypothetical protein
MLVVLSHTQDLNIRLANNNIPRQEYTWYPIDEFHSIEG